MKTQTENRKIRLVKYAVSKDVHPGRISRA